VQVVLSRRNIQFITHEIVFLFFISFSLWLYFFVVHKKNNTLVKIVFFLLFSVVIALSTQINASGYVAIIAILGVWLFFDVYARWFLRISKCVMLLAVLIVVVLCMNIIKPNLLNQDAVSSLKVNSIQWTLFVGSNTEKHGGFSDGDLELFGYNKDDSNTFDEKGLSDSEVLELRKELLTNRYIYLIHNPKSILSILSVKFLRIWSYCNYPLSELSVVYGEWYADYLKPVLSAFELYFRLFLLIGSMKEFRRSKWRIHQIYSFNATFLLDHSFSQY